jgi:tetratricopeptide (TPR) repeat protein
MLCRFVISTLAVSFAASIFVSVGIAEDNDGDKPRVNEKRVVELAEMIKSKPNDAANYRLRAFEYAMDHVWDKAAADFVQVAKLRGGNSHIGQQIAVFLVLADDKKTHETICTEMFEGFSQSNDRGDLERTAKICTLMRKAVGKLEKLLEISKRSVELGKNRDYACHHYRTLALVLYRMEKYDQAIETVRAGDNADAAARFQIPNVIVCNRAIEAMCLIRGGKVDEAKDVLAKATPVLTERFKNQSLIYQGAFWHDWLVARVLHDEAQQLVEKPPK